MQEAGTTYKTLGRSVTDATRATRPIRITNADIRGAVCKSRTQCVIARAIKRATGAPWVEVRAAVVYVGDTPETGKRYVHTSLSRDQVRFFDQRGRFAPCSIQLAAPRGRRALGARRGEPHGTNVRSGLKRRKPTR